MAEQSTLEFAGLLRQLRAEARLTQEELAEAAGLSPRSVSDLERGINRTARKDTAELLAGALGLAEPARAVFVAAARGRAPAAEVLAAVRGEASPASEGPAPGESLVWSGCPYLGLVPFEERDARVFYGRGEMVAQLVQRLAERLDGTGMLLVAGESGAGKSSLLRAGLMPWLAAGALGPGSQRWPRRVIRPTGRPLRELAMQLAEVAGADPVSVYRSLSAAPDEAPMLVEQAVRTATSRGPDPGTGRRRPMPRPARRRAWCWWSTSSRSCSPRAGTLTPAGWSGRRSSRRCTRRPPSRPARRNCPAALVVAAVRADFLGRLIAYPPLKAALEAGPFTVGPMSEAELRLAITGPAAEAGLAVEPALVEAVIAELREGTGGGLGSGVLPLMSQAMAATWQRPRGQRADPARLPARGRGRRRGQPQRPGRLRHPDQPAEGRGAPGVHPADRHHPGWPARAAPVQQDRSARPGITDGGRHRRGHRRLQRPAPARPRSRTASRSPMTRCCRPGNSSGTGWEMTSSTGPCTARSSPTRTPGTATAGTPPTCTGRAARHHRRGHHPVAGRAHPLPPAARHR